jgi:hypothetical protein
MVWMLGSLGCGASSDEPIVDDGTSEALLIKGGKGGKGGKVNVENKGGLIHGKLTEQGSQKGLPGVDVLLQKYDHQGQVQIVGRTKTNAEGSYQLGNLKLGEKYMIAAQPNVQGKSYEGQVSPEIQLTREKNTSAFNPSFKVAQDLGDLDVELLPKGTGQETDNCSLLQEQSGRQYIVVQKQANEQSMAQFNKVPAGKYNVKCERSRKNDAGSVQVIGTKQSAAQVFKGMKQSLQIQF